MRPDFSILADDAYQIRDTLAKRRADLLTVCSQRTEAVQYQRCERWVVAEPLVFRSLQLQY